MPHKKKKSKDSGGASKPKNGGPDISFPEAPYLDLLKSTYSDVKTNFHSTSYAMNFKNIYTTRIYPIQQVPIDRAICIGLGSLSRIPAGFAHPLSSYTQLAAFESWVECLRAEQKRTTGEVHLKHVYLQDPLFSTIDIKFIEKELGFAVIGDHAAFAVITDSTFLFAPFAPVDIKYSILYAASPAILVGNRLGSILPCSKFSDWCLSTKTITAFYTSRNFATMGSPDCIKRNPCIHTLAWLDDMILYYPAGTEEDRILPFDVDLDESDSKSLDACIADIMALYNVSNIELRTWYEKLPKNITFEDMMACTTENGKSAMLNLGPGEWTESNGFVFDPLFLSVKGILKHDAETKADLVSSQFEIMAQIEQLANVEDKVMGILNTSKQNKR